MTELVKIHLHLTGPQFHKLRHGKTIQLSHEQLEKGEPHHLMVHPHKAKKIHHAMKHRKGVRLSMTEPEFMETAEGGGFMDFINKLKDAGKWIKDKVIDSGFYQSNIKPIARNLVNAGLVAATPYLGAATPVASTAVDAIGKATNAFGLPHKKGHRRSSHPNPMRNFVVDSLVQPIPGQSGFTAMPQAIGGDGAHGHHAQQVHHHYYYPQEHSHMGGRGGRYRKSEAMGGSFRMA